MNENKDKTNKTALWMNEYTLFYKNHVYKNVKAQISKKNKNMLRTYLRLKYVKN